MELMQFKQFVYFDTINDEYVNLCDRSEDWKSSPFYIPFVGDLNKEVFQSVELDTAEKLMEEAQLRGDYEIYGMDPKTFLIEAQRGAIEGFRNTIPTKEINLAVFMHLNHFHVSHLDYFLDVINPPVRSVW